MKFSMLKDAENIDDGLDYGSWVAMKLRPKSASPLLSESPHLSFGRYDDNVIQNDKVFIEACAKKVLTEMSNGGIDFSKGIQFTTVCVGALLPGQIEPPASWAALHRELGANGKSFGSLSRHVRGLCTNGRPGANCDVV